MSDPTPLEEQMRKFPDRLFVVREEASDEEVLYLSSTELPKNEDDGTRIAVYHLAEKGTLSVKWKFDAD